MARVPRASGDEPYQGINLGLSPERAPMAMGPASLVFPARAGMNRLS